LSDDFDQLEAEMKKIIKENQPFERIVVSREVAMRLANEGQLGALGPRAMPSKYKLDILRGISQEEVITLYRNGDFTDLCAGPHVMRTGNIGAFKLTSIASAYYKRDASNPQLQRVYGTAFKTRTELDQYSHSKRLKRTSQAGSNWSLSMTTRSDPIDPLETGGNCPAGTSSLYF
jgi:threonyl-tRNA synthetase